MSKRCIYILKGKRYYIGSTNNLERRLTEHKNKGYSVKRIGDWKCLGYIECLNLLEARRLEKAIKKSCHPERYIQQDIFIRYKENT
ncbi:MAG: GIY-YIG nuclease family protein [Candidatus Absconditabacterales bacterium]